MKNGTLAALSAYVLWGLLPVYWKTIEHVPAQEILSHRVVGSLAVSLGLLMLRRQWGWLKEAVRKPAILIPYVGTASLLTVNWLVYIWANNNGHIVEVSLGYFINPLLNVLLGVVFLRERMRPWQWAAIGLAFAGVAYLTLSYGRLPWIALTLALSFGVYGLIRKTAALESVQGLTVETGLMFLPAIGYLAYLGEPRRGFVRHGRRANYAAPGPGGFCHGDSIDPVRLWRTPRAAHHARRAAIRRADAAIPVRCAGLRRKFHHVPTDRILPDLDGVGAILGRRSHHTTARRGSSCALIADSPIRCLADSLSRRAS